MTFQLRLATDQLIELPKPAVMGIINVTPNSFFNAHTSVESALRTAEAMVQAGVDILDIGGEATNPAVNIALQAPSLQIECDRVLPVLEAIRHRFDTLISIDTSRATLMREAAALGADIINDQRALTLEGALTTVAELKLPVCLMHFFTEPRIPGSSSLPALMSQIKQELLKRVLACEAAGITRDRIILDPGFGQGNYSKNAEENFYLLAEIQQLLALGFPILSGWSRKSMLGEALQGAPTSERLYASVAADTLASFMGVHVLRGHDVKATKDAIAVVKRARDVKAMSEISFI